MGTVGAIERVFDDEGVDPEPWEQRWDAPGQRRGTFDRYTAKVDWSDPVAVRRVLNAFEEIYTWGQGEYADKARATLVRHLQRDDYVIDDRGRIGSGVAKAAADLPLEGIRDPSAILEHLDRIGEASDRDPPLAISQAKALIEATTKLVLGELGEGFDEKADLPALVRQVQKALGLHRDTLAPTAAGQETVKRLLSNLSQVAIGIAELRNEYGPDHGRGRPAVKLTPRHAHLAVGSAATYCRMLIETLGARRG